MIVPPFGTSSAQDYEHGYADGQTPFVPPVLPAPPIVQSDRVYLTANYLNLAAAIAQAQKDGARSPAFLFPRGTITPSSGLILKPVFNSVTFGTTVGSGPLPVIDCSDIFLNCLSVPNVCVRDLVISCAVPFREAGLRFDSCANIVVCNVTVNGFTYGIELTGGGNINAKIIGNTFAEQVPAPGSHGAGLYTQGTSKLIVAGNLFRHCAWLADPSNLGVQNQSHGWYGNQTGSSDDALCIGNLFLDCGGSALGCRNAGEFAWNVMRGGSDASIIPQSQSTIAANVHDTAIFGPVPDAVPNYGGGVKILASNAIVTNTYLSSNASTPPNPPIMVQPGPLPNGTVTITATRGWWPKPPTVLGIAGRPFIESGSRVRQTLPSMPVPRLADFYGCAESQLYAMAKASDAPLIVDWMRRSCQAAGL